MNQRDKSIKQLEGFFSGKRIDKRSLEPYTVFKTTRNGKLVEPKGMTEKDFDSYLTELKSRYSNILIFVTELQE
jgi:hypothetical protein